MGEGRWCSSCRSSKPLESFAWRRRARAQRDNMCRDCRSAYKRQHYLKNKERYVAQARLRKQALARERTAYLLEYFAAHPCVDCGEADPVVLEFDHVRGEKAFDIGQSLPYRSWASILAEIEKCEVVCSNCHRRRTARRLGSVRSILARDREPS